jgi:hypothetical protein
MDIIHELPSEAYIHAARTDDDSLTVALTSFKYSAIYLFRRASILLEDHWQANPSAVSFLSSVEVLALLRFALRCLETLCGWCDTSVGEGVAAGDLTSWLEVTDLCSCTVEVSRSADAESSVSGVCVSGDAWEGSVMHVLSASMLPLLTALVSDSTASSLPAESRYMAEKCLGAALELMLSFLQSASAEGCGYEAVCQDVPAQQNMCVAVATAYEAMTGLAAMLFFRSECTFVDGSSLVMEQLSDLKAAIAHVSRGSLCVAIDGVGAIALHVVHSRLAELCGEGEESAVPQIALNYVECVMCLVDRHLVFIFICGFIAFA